MQTKCPNCGVSYEVDDHTLAVCGGEIRCFHCEQVFNVLQVEEGYQPPDVRAPEEQLLPSISAVAATPEPRLEQRHDSGDQVEDIPAPRPVPAALAEADQPKAAPQEDLESEVIELAELTDEAVVPQRRWWVSALGVLTILALALGALAQWGWWKREWLLGHPSLGPSLVQLGAPMGLRWQPPADPRLFKILQRDLAPDPLRQGVLLLRAAARNDSHFPQPLPFLQLTLLDNAQAVVARRTFEPAQYLPPASSLGPAVAPKQVFTLELAFEDPGILASGFQLDFRRAN